MLHWVLVSISLSLVLAGGGGGGGTSWDDSVSKHFAEHHSYRFRLSGKWPDSTIKDGSPNGKPIMVFVTQPWCGACNNLKTQVNGDESIKVRP